MAGWLRGLKVEALAERVRPAGLLGELSAAVVGIAHVAPDAAAFQFERAVVLRLIADRTL